MKYVQKNEMIYYICLLTVLSCAIKISYEKLEMDVETESSDIKYTQRLLSRKRRYLVFPEGSSLQLVYCLTIPSLGVGQIFTLGSTAALAWELPHDPISPFRNPAEILHRNDKPVKASFTEWTLQNEKYLASRNQFSSFLMNESTPLYSYNTLWNQSTSPAYDTLKNGQSTKIWPYYNFNKYSLPIRKVNTIKSQYQTKKKIHRPVTTYVHPIYYNSYRRTRRDLYSKLENLLTALSRNGKACVFKAICEVSQVSKRRGSFMEEILKAVFRIKPHEEYENENEYDTAANENHNCKEMFDSCSDSIFSYLV